MSSHYATIVVVGVGGVIGELSNCEGRLALLFATLCLIVAKLATVSALGVLVLTAQSAWLFPLLPDAPRNAFVASCQQ